ncbi:MAG: histidine kinase [Bacteroidia bacterium]|nr:histidine kinase [Bacteroidia bacterium]
MKKIFVLFSFICILSVANAQNLNEITLEILDEEDGLSSHWIQDVALDSGGYIWVGTLNGLNRYDGYGFKIFKHSEKDSASLLSDYGQKIYVNRNGDIWISYSKGGISLFNPDFQCFTHYEKPKINEKLKVDDYFGIQYIDTDGNLWFSGNGLGLNIFYPEENKIEHIDLPFLADKQNEKEDRVPNTVNSIYAGEGDILWLCTQNGFYRFNKKTKKFEIKSAPGFQYGFHKLIPEGNQGFWLSSWSGFMSYFDLKSESFRHFPLKVRKEGSFSFSNLIDDIATKDEKTLWIVSSDNGLGIFEKETGIFEFQKVSKENNLQKLFFPHKLLKLPNKAFFLTDETALMKYNPFTQIFNFKKLAIEESQHGDLFGIRKIIENPERKEIYFATDFGNGLNILNTETQELVALPVEVNQLRDKKMRVYDLVTDKEGKMWLLSRDYLYEFDYVHKKLIKIEQPFENEADEKNISFRYFIMDSENNLWVSSNEGGVYPFSPQKRKLLTRINRAKNGQKTIENVYTTCFDKQDNLWIQGNKSLAFYPKGEDNCTFVTDKQALEWLKGEVKGMKADTNGNIWIGVSDRGFLKIDCQDMKHLSYCFITTEEGLPSVNMNVMGTDFMGNVWASTLSGVVCMNTNTYQIKIFNESVGMDKFTRGIRFIRGENQCFYITSPGRYCKVNYSEINQYIPPPKTYIASFKVLNAERRVALDGSQTVILSPQENFFSFDFSCIDYTNQSHHEFAYMLEGWDKDWVTSGKRRYVGYTNLNGGHYTFRVKGKNGEGVWGNTVSIPVFVETPFYKKTAFQIICILLFMAGLYGLYLYRVRQIQETERIKTEFNSKLAETRMQALRAQMNPHFIFNCLNSINRYIIKSDIKTASLYLTRFSKLIRLILDNSQHKSIPLSDELTSLKLYMELEAFRFDKKFDFEVKVDNNVDADSIEVPPLLFQPYVENAIWHGLLHKATQGNIWIHLSQSDDILTCSITDNGIGREKAMEYKSKTSNTRKSLGMKLTEERLKISGKDEFSGGTQKIIDLMDDGGNACGTQVVITLSV